MRMRSGWGRILDPLVLVELFIAANLAFLAVDIYVAHSMNGFAHWAEWIPFGFSLVAPVLFVISWLMAGSLRPAVMKHDALTPRRRAAIVLGMLVGAGSIAVGITGLVLHLESHFFQQQTLRNLVYAAPFVAPLAYSGIGMLVLLDRMVRSESDEWARWIVLLALGGWIGNFVLSLTDHAQNAFFYWAEWIPVCASAIGVGALIVAIADYRNRRYLQLCIWVMGIETVVGMAGWILHLNAIAKSPMESMWHRIVYSAPVFAPLLFVNLALLAVISLGTLEVRSKT
jgi:hypothetical protein